MGQSQPEPSPSPSSVSPDKKWEYRQDGYRLEIVKAGTTEVMVDLAGDLTISNKDAGDAQVVWAPDSKRFAFNYKVPSRPHTSREMTALYQLRDAKWVALHSPVEEASVSSQLVQLNEHLPKGFNPRHCMSNRDVLKLRSWTDANTAILYAPCYGRTSEQLETAFLFTLKFDDAGNWKIVKTHLLSEKEIKKFEH